MAITLTNPVTTTTSTAYKAYQQSLAANSGSAYDAARAQLTAWGIGELSDDVINLTKQGLDQPSFLLALRNTQSYKDRFAGNALRLAKGMEVLSEKDYLSKEEQYRQVLADPKYGLPANFYNSPDDYAKMIGTDMGGAEITSRLDAIKSVVTDGAMNGTLAYAQSAYGLNTGDLMALWLDPDRAQANIVSRQAKASVIGAAAARTGFGAIAATDAERLDALGISGDQAQAGFAELAGLTPLEQGVGDAGAVSQQDLMAAGFEKNAGALQKVQRSVDTRKAAFAGGGTYASGQGGVTGLGSANT